jgi:hypothetical protein
VPRTGYGGCPAWTGCPVDNRQEVGHQLVSAAGTRHVGCVRREVGQEWYCRGVTRSDHVEAKGDRGIGRVPRPLAGLSAPRGSTGSCAGEMAATQGRYPQCPRAVGPSGADIVLRRHRRWGPVPRSGHARRTRKDACWAGPAGMGRRLRRGDDTRSAPGRSGHLGQRSYSVGAGGGPPPPGSARSAPWRRTSGRPRSWGGGCNAGAIPPLPRVGGAIRGSDRIGEGADRRAAPPPGPYPQCPRRTRLGPALGLARRLRHGCATSTVPRVGGPSGAEIVLGRAATVGRPHHPGHTRSAPEGCASDEDQLRGRDGERRIFCSDGICGGGERELQAAGALPIRWMPRVVGRAVMGTDACRCG